MKDRIIVEVCAGSLEDAIVADECGADRIELNSALPLDGLTPSFGLLQTVIDRVDIPVIAMVRPRENGFCYSESEFMVMRHDIDAILEAGATGIAVGILKDSCLVDVERISQIRRQIGDRELVFHRAFDLIPASDRNNAVELLIGAGIDRLMTSGGEPTAYQGVEAIQEITELADSGFQVIPASGINHKNAVEIIEKSGVSQIHGTFSRQVIDPSAQSCIGPLDNTSESPGFRQTDRNELKKVIDAVQAAKFN